MRKKLKETLEGSKILREEIAKDKVIVFEIRQDLYKLEEFHIKGIIIRD